jgi:hypothetical protein
MKDILIVELYASTLRLCKYEKEKGTFVELDITGGYGKKAVPYYVHYIEDEINPLIGEDALLYDNVDRIFVDSMLKDKAVFYDYMTVLITKLQAQHSIGLIQDIVFMYSEQMAVEELKRSVDFQGYSISWIGLKECLIGYLDLVRSKNQQNSFLVAFDEKMGYICYEKDETIEFNVVELSMEELDRFYRESINDAHPNGASEYQIVRLFESQKSMIHQQLLTQKDIKVYSSIHYPPFKITLKFEKASEFLIQWEKQYGAPFLQLLNRQTPRTMEIATTYTEHPLIKMILGKKVKEAQSIDFLLAQGVVQCLFNEHTRQKVKEVLHKTPKFTSTYFLKINNQKHCIIQTGYEFTREIGIDLVLTGEENDIELFLVEQSINRVSIMTTKPFQMIDYKVIFDEAKNVCEVKYEFR